MPLDTEIVLETIIGSETNGGGRDHLYEVQRDPPEIVG